MKRGKRTHAAPVRGRSTNGVTTRSCHKHLRAVPQGFTGRIFLPWSFCVLLFPNQKEQNCAHKTDNSQSNEDSSAIALCGKTKEVITRCAKAIQTSSTTFKELVQTYYFTAFKTHTNSLTYLPRGAKGTQLLANSCLGFMMPIRYWHMKECPSHFLPCKGYD